MTEIWERDAETPDEYHSVEAIRGREFIIRLTTGADVFLAIQKFAIDNNIEFAKIHAAFMGGLYRLQNIRGSTTATEDNEDITWLAY